MSSSITSVVVILAAYLVGVPGPAIGQEPPANKRLTVEYYEVRDILGAERTDKKVRSLRERQLRDLVVAKVAPTTWQGDVVFRIKSGTLIVRQTATAHAEVKKYLDTLRKSTARWRTPASARFPARWGPLRTCHRRWRRRCASAS